jgi:Zn-dependent alcohol dehydrogenase
MSVVRPDTLRLTHGRLAQRESTALTTQGSLVRSQYRPPRKNPGPLVLRDEAAAIVDEVGDGVEGLAPGDLPMLAGLLRGGDLDLAPMIARKIRLEDINDALERFETGEVTPSVIRLSERRVGSLAWAVKPWTNSGGQPTCVLEMS